MSEIIICDHYNCPYYDCCKTKNSKECDVLNE